MIAMFLLFALGVVLLLTGSELLVRGGAHIARALGISEFVIGVTIVALGTSIPELASSFYASYAGHFGIAFGNVIGSNVANIALVLGIAAMVGVFKVTQDEIRDVPLLIAAALAPFFVAFDLKITIFEGILMLFVYSYFIVETIWSHKEKINKKRKNLKPLYGLFVLLSFTFIYFGARLTIMGAAGIAEIFGITEGIIGFSLVALSTSLPELLTSAIAALRRKIGLSIGNVIGSNVFNTFVVLGASAIANQLLISKATLSFEVPAMILLSFLLAFEMLDREISKLSGFLFILAYIFIMLNLF